MFNFDNSLLADYAKCKAHAIVKHALGRQSKGGKIYADLGSAGHAAIEQHFKGASRSKVLQVFELEYDKVIPIGQEPEKPEFAKENLKTILDVYCEQRPVEAFPFEPIEFEQTIGVEIDEGLKFWMKRDLLGKDRVSKMLYPIDHKFRFGQINEWWTKKFRMTSQFSGYDWGTSQTTGQLCDKVYVNAISFGKLPDSTKKCAKHKVPYLECRRQHAEFELLVYTRTEEQIEKWRQDAIFLAKQAEVYFQAYGALEALPFALRDGTFNESCTFCEFADWCRIGFDKAMVDEFTVYEPWEPWAGGGIEQGTQELKEDLIYNIPQELEKELDPPKLQWFYRQVNHDVVATLQGSPGANWVELAEPMALKTLWEKGRDAWMRVWQETPAAQEAMAGYARLRQGGIEG